MTTDAPNSAMPRQRDEWLVLFVLAGFSTYLASLVYESYQLDFRAFYVAAEAYAHHLNPYENHVLASPLFEEAGNVKPFSRFLYPPTALPFFWPLGQLPYPAARFGFTAIVGATLVALLMWLERRFRLEPIAVVACFIGFPVLATFERGQIDVLILALTLLFWANRRRWWAGGCLAVAIALKLTPVFVLLYLLFRREWRAIASVLAWLGAIGLLTYPLLDPAWWGSFTHTMHLMLTQTPTPELSVSIPGEHLDGSFFTTPRRHYILYHGFVHGTLNPFPWLFGALGIPVSVAVMAAYAWVTRHRPAPAVFFYFLLLAQLANPLLWITGMVWYLPLAASLFPMAGRSALRAILVLLPLFLPSWVEVAGFNANYVAALAIGGWFLWQERGAGASDSPASPVAN